MAVVRVIGCGNPDVGDDAVGIVAVAAARERLEAIPGVEVVPRASPLEVVHLLEGARVALVVDAIRTPGGGRSPGEVVRAESGPDGLPAEIRSSLSSHGLGIAEAVGLALATGSAPRVVVLGVEALEAEAGGPLSGPVAAAVPALIGLLVAEARSLAAAHEPGSREAERSPAEGPTDSSRGASTGRP
ncbi:MAG: hydrogenase maturation protease [Actinomycetota bacterium]